MVVANGWPLEHRAYPYQLYSLSVTYTYHTGQEAVAVSYDQGSPLPNTGEAVQVTQPQGRKVVSFEMLRQAKPPDIPDPTPVSANEVLLDAVVVMTDPKIDASGEQYLYGAKGEYTYLLKQPIFTTSSKYPLGALDAGQRQEGTFSTAPGVAD
jgi:hypothetical protein